MTTGTSTSSADNSSAAPTNKTENSNYPTPCRAGADRKAIAMRAIPRPKTIGACLTAAALLLGFTAPAHAQQELVSNTDANDDGQYKLTHEDSAAQAFTTGSNRTGYDLDSIVVDIKTFPASGNFAFAVELWSVKTNGQPDSVSCTLSDPTNLGTGLQTFTAPDSCPTLEKEKEYFVVMSFELTGGNVISDLPEWWSTQSESEDSGAATGWSIGNDYYYRTTNNAAWISVSDSSLQMKVKGAYGNKDKAALVALYEATDGDNWNTRTNWESNQPLGSWEGVTTNNDGRVIGLDLASNYLDGDLPADLGDLTYLETLSLLNNELTGSIPDDLGDLTNLTNLTLSDNDLTGEIPGALGVLTNLEKLELRANDLTGSIPGALGNLTNLTKLNLISNGLTGSIPVALGDLTNLEALLLGGNGLDGGDPGAVGQLEQTRTTGALHKLPDGVDPGEIGRLGQP